jgi:hypothetical protein
MEVAVVAEAEEVEFETFAFDHLISRDVVDDNLCEIGLTGLRTERSEFRASKSDEVLVFGMFVLKSF